MFYKLVICLAICLKFSMSSSQEPNSGGSDDEQQGGVAENPDETVFISQQQLEEIQQSVENLGRQIRESKQSFQKAKQESEVGALCYLLYD